MNFTASFEQVKREHPTWDASRVAREMQRRSVEARRRKGRWQGQNRPAKGRTYWWQEDEP